MRTEAIHAGDLYDNSRGMRTASPCDGMLVQLGGFVDVVPLERLISVCGQFGCRVKRRRDGDEKAESDGR